MSYFLKIKDKAAIEANLEDETEYQFTGVITTKGFKSDPDGEGGNDITIGALFTSHLTLIKGDKTLIKGRDKKSMSKKLRGAIWHMQDEKERMDMDEEVFYQKMMGVMISHLPEIYERYKQEI